jgi:RNA 2',3'-cyclic 3'-phosphodiesterase
MRTFIAIDLPEEIKKEIVKIQKQIPDFKGKLTEFENLHLTLKFLGEVNDEELKKIREALNKIKIDSFEAEINFIGIFSEQFIRIVWLGISNCGRLQEQIDEALKEMFRKEDRFMGHLTIARVKSVKNKKEFLKELKQMKIPKMNFKVKDFYLKKSVLTEEKPAYENIEIYNLN